MQKYFHAGSKNIQSMYLKTLLKLKKQINLHKNHENSEHSKKYNSIQITKKLDK